VTLGPRQVAHRTHAATAVYFVQKGALDRRQFEGMLAVLESRAGRCDTGATIEPHWVALSERMTGRSPWDALVQTFEGPIKGVEAAKRFRASEHGVTNILAWRPYTAYTVAGIQYVVDLFNPANELEMSYAGAGETVVALLLRELDFGGVQYRLVENEAFYEIVREIADILDPEFVRGTYSMFPVLMAYEDGRLDPKRRPWELLFPLSVLSKPTDLVFAVEPTKSRTTNDSLALLWTLLTDPKVRELPIARLFKRVEIWDEGRVLVQVGGGLESVLRDEYVEAARTLGMTAVQELVVA